MQATMGDLITIISSLKINVEKFKWEHTFCMFVGASNNNERWLLGSDLPKPKPFTGEHDAKELDNFYWKMRQYLKAKCITDEPSKIVIASTFLTDMAMLRLRWKHHKIQDDMCRIDSRDTF